MSDDRQVEVLVADDDESFRVMEEHHLRQAGFAVDVVENGLEVLDAVSEKSYDVLLLDILMPELDGIEVLRRLAAEEDRPETIMVTGHGSVESAIEAMKLGAYDYLEKPYRPAELILLVQKARELRRLSTDNRRLKARVDRAKDLPEIVTQDERMLRVIDLAGKVAASDSAVLITGESGTGKELVAQTIHQLSPRARQPIVPVNCAALPDSLLESELFGHEKGAFTGAGQRKLGLFELADESTLFMDEIGDLAPQLQGKLLRVLEDQAFRRVGGVKEIRADFRLVAATNQNLPDMVEGGAFRRDLYYRLNTIVIDLPPLRERPDDIPLIARHFLRRLPESDEHTLTDEAADKLRNYSWPGNVRELKNVIERTLLLVERDRIGPADLLLDRRLEAPAGSGAGVADPSALDGDLSMKAMERRHIERVLDHADGHQGNAAQLLGISPKTLYRKMKAYDIEKP